MGKTNKDIEKRRKQKREAERKRREQIKNNPEGYEKAKASESQPEELIKSLCCENKMEESCLEKRCDNCKQKKVTWNEINKKKSAVYKKWILVNEEIIVKGIKKTCKKYIKKDVICNKEKMMEALQHDLAKYMQHIANIRHQYQFIDTLKDSLEKQDVFVHMDFSENYQCKYIRKIQSAHFGGATPQISLIL
ncbi:unnamed protein product [Psylliodes chrysocephalus]|uniref:Uncharacterized protein n=1 Tax=Psylliodes chrysocephalus TaxID=3402493 RepID=A0A9P0CLD5_9CUCU|nr:unnamed protein product [Psylliodes chrysocephala]